MKIIIKTKYGNVAASNSATLYGEGPNITGFVMTAKPHTHTVAETNEFHIGFGNKAEIWAEGETYYSTPL